MTRRISLRASSLSWSIQRLAVPRPAKDSSTDYKVVWLPGYNQFEHEGGLLGERGREHSAEYWNAYQKAHHILFKAMVRRGVKVVAGTDSGGNLIVPGFSMHDELASLHNAGMSNAQALATATINPGQMMKSNAGSIEAGKRADLVLLNSNPLLNINNTRDIDTVILNGRVLDRSQLDKILDAVLQANDRSRKINIDQYR